MTYCPNKMKVHPACRFSLFILFFFNSLVLSAQVIQIIPQPAKVEVQSGSFKLTNKVKLVIPAGNQECRDVATLFSQMLAVPTGWQLAITDKSSSESIQLSLNATPDAALGEEGYTLEVSSNGVRLAANRPAGLFYGMQTFVQLLPKEIESKTPVSTANWSIAAVKITDFPRFGWRGLMLDVSRHFFPKEFVKSYIDQMVKYKMNRFHWHLSDDNGWRIEIKSLPNLTKTGAWRVPRVGQWWHFETASPGEEASYGGFYTQDDIREIVQYAQARYVTILPEIDVPGHSLAMIASYPQVSCNGLQPKVDPGTRFYGKQTNSLCPGNEQTFEVLDKVFTEIAELFPSEYIHIGGDECLKGFWKKCPKCQKRMADNKLKTVNELQSYFVRRLETMLKSKGKKLIGWDEILEGGLAPDATVMSWRGMKGGIEAAKQNHKVVMSPNQFCYLDLYQGDPSVEPHTYSVCRLSSSYQFEPVPNGVEASSILGGQGNLWTEHIATDRQAQYMVWPRAFALAEVLWSPKETRNWDDFVRRMEGHFERYDVAGINYARSAYDPIIKSKKGLNGKTNIELSAEVNGLDIHYTFDVANPDAFYPKYTQPLAIPPGATEIRVVTYRNGKPVGKQINKLLKDLGKK